MFCFFMGDHFAVPFVVIASLLDAFSHALCGLHYIRIEACIHTFSSLFFWVLAGTHEGSLYRLFIMRNSLSLAPHNHVWRKDLLSCAYCCAYPLLSFLTVGEASKSLKPLGKHWPALLQPPSNKAPVNTLMSGFRI